MSVCVSFRRIGRFGWLEGHRYSCKSEGTALTQLPDTQSPDPALEEVSTICTTKCHHQVIVFFPSFVFISHLAGLLNTEKWTRCSRPIFQSSLDPPWWELRTTLWKWLPSCPYRMALSNWWFQSTIASFSSDPDLCLSVDLSFFFCLWDWKWC